MECKSEEDIAGVHVSVKDFARIVGVDESAVYHAMRRGRLKKSVFKTENRKRILNYEGCIEWFIKKNTSKDRTVQDDSDIEDSRKRKEFFQSLITKLDYRLKSGQLVSISEAAKLGSQVCLAARRKLEETRDQDCYKFSKIKDEGEARDLLRARDDAFLDELTKLPEVIGNISKNLREVAGETKE